MPDGYSTLLDKIKHEKLAIYLDASGTNFFELQLIGSNNRTQAAYRQLIDPYGWDDYWNIQVKSATRWDTDSKLFDVIFHPEFPTDLIVYVPDGHPQGYKYLYIRECSTSGGSEVLYVTFLETPRFIKEGLSSHDAKLDKYSFYTKLYTNAIRLSDKNYYWNQFDNIKI